MLLMRLISYNVCYISLRNKVVYGVDNLYTSFNKTVSNKQIQDIIDNWHYCFISQT